MIQNNFIFNLILQKLNHILENAYLENIITFSEYNNLKNKLQS